MKLNQLRDNRGARSKKMVVGRGIGSGKGKTSGRGVKGQKARTGVSIKGFEGGQMPLIRRMPKRGFKNVNTKNFAEVTLDMIQAGIDAKRISASKTLDAAALIEGGVVHAAYDGIALLGSGELKTKVNLTVTRATAGAIKAVEKAGGKVEVLPEKVNKLLKKKPAAK
jgi:large subunit ribosomal protein L15